MVDTLTLLARRHLAPDSGTPLFYEHPLHIVRGESIYLYDPDGRRYVEMYNNVPGIGHPDPRVVEAMTRQQAMLDVHGRSAPNHRRSWRHLAALSPGPPKLPASRRHYDEWERGGSVSVSRFEISRI
jgi:4-aminobutyrate aminotransferase-like enzyme